MGQEHIYTVKDGAVLILIADPTHATEKNNSIMPEWVMCEGCKQVHTVDSICCGKDSYCFSPLMINDTFMGVEYCCDNPNVSKEVISVHEAYWACHECEADRKPREYRVTGIEIDTLPRSANQIAECYWKIFCKLKLKSGAVHRRR